VRGRSDSEINVDIKNSQEKIIFFLILLFLKILPRQKFDRG
jgi:hypothetical protein